MLKKRIKKHNNVSTFLDVIIKSKENRVWMFYEEGIMQEKTIDHWTRKVTYHNMLQVKQRVLQ